MTEHEKPGSDVTAPESFGASILTPAKLLVCVDDSAASRAALRFACIQAARRGGSVTLLHVVQPSDFQSLMGVADRMREEARQKGEALLSALKTEAEAICDAALETLLREGEVGEEILRATAEDHAAGMLVLGVNPGAARDKLIGWIATQMGERLLIPLMLVPGNLTDQQIEALG